MLTVDECENIVKTLKNGKLKTLDITVVNLTNENFILNVAAVVGTKKKTLSYFAKPALKIPKIHEILEEFKNSVPNFDHKITPKFYCLRSNLQFFEDLTWQGFQNVISEFDLNHSKIALESLAKFHSGSLVYEEIKSREVGRKFSLDQKYKEKNVNFDSGTIGFISSLVGENVSKIVKDLEERKISSKFRKTLCHGNLNLQNLMFKYDNLNPAECKLINFEGLYLPPILDFLHLIFFNTDEDFRQHHLEDLLFYYHHCLEKELKKCSLNIEEILPFEELQNQTHQFLPLVKLEVALRKEDDDAAKKVKEIFDSSILSREDCFSITRTKTGSTNYKLLSFKVTPLDQVNGYLGNYHKLKIKICQESEETINCFVKSMPKNTASRNIIQETGCFFKEVFIYQTLIPQMQKLGINTIDECLPKCYFQRSEDVLVFDDLTLQHYKTLPSQVPFDLPLLSLVVKKLARFHASMMIFEEKKSAELGRNYRLGEEYKKYLKEIFFTEEEKHSGSVLMQTGVHSVVDVINLFPEIKTEVNLENFEKMWPKLQELFYSVIKPSKRYRNVLCHGDLWTNNIMVKFDGNEPIDCAFVDFQIVRYCPPAHDFLSVLFLTTNRTTRIEHEEEMKFLYYEELVKILESYNFKSDEILPFEEFIESVDFIRPQMVMQAIMYKSFCLCTSEEISSFLVSDEITNFVFFQDRKEYLSTICEKSKTVASALRGCILDLYDLCNKMSPFM